MYRSTSAILFAYALMLSGCGHRAGGVDIWDAVKKGDVAAIGKFANAGGDLNIQNFNGNTPLWVALRDENRDSYEALLKHGADLDVTVRVKRAVVHRAASNHDSWWLQLALERGANPNLFNIEHDGHEGTPLTFAIKSGITKEVELVEHVKLLIEHGADVNKLVNFDSPVALAAGQDDFKIVLLLLESGADYENAEDSEITFIELMNGALKYRELEVFFYEAPENRQAFDAVRAWLSDHGVELGEN